MNKKTTYILHGGFKPEIKQENDAFFSEVLKNAPSKSKVLIIYFATDNGDKYFAEDMEQFNKNSRGKSLSFNRATQEDFEKQLSEADVIYLHGGSSLPLNLELKKFPNFSSLIQGKIVAGDSAGANALATLFYSRRNGVGEGLSILPIKIIPHFVEENREKLSDIRPELKTVQLSEYEYLTIIQ